MERFSLWVLGEVTYHNGTPLWREPGEIFPVGSGGSYIPQWNSSMERAWRDFPCRFWGKLHTTMELLYEESLERFSL